MSCPWVPGCASAACEDRAHQPRPPLQPPWCPWVLRLALVQGNTFVSARVDGHSFMVTLEICSEVPGTLSLDCHVDSMTHWTISINRERKPQGGASWIALAS